MSTPKRLALGLLVTVGVVAVAAAALVEMTPTPRSSPRPMPNFPTRTADPAPWHYDTVNNRHWDPSHNHWHDGPPPAAATRQSSSSAPAPVPSTPGAATEPTPEPWYYDAATDRHWDPGHNHWHNGPPPANR